MSAVPTDAAASKRPTPWEVGGDFDLADGPDPRRVPWPTPHRLYGLATHALTVLWGSLPGAPSRTLHVPDYFCPEVVEAWERAGIRMQAFADDPRWPEPDWSTLRTAEGDAVLAVNFFGVRAGHGWSRWRRRNPGRLLIEDHSHDPMSTWVRTSTADYAFASLRKTIPVSDGAILWSPRGATLPGDVGEQRSNGADLKLAGMVLKRRYLAGDAIAKDAFRTLQLQGERDLLASSPAAMSPWSRSIVAGGSSAVARDRRRRNVRTLLGRIEGATHLRPLFTSWPRGHCPFNVLLAFETEAARDACRTHLIREDIYPPVHWAQPADANRRVGDLAATILTVPADQRYGVTDMERVATVLRSFDAAWAGHEPSGSARGAQSIGRGAR
jgi:hypothetical protein